jgi:(p)ppGpp synthase/HD superfamily hydrolase
MGPESDFGEGCIFLRLEKAKDFAKEHLPSGKYEHSIRVMRHVRELAPLYLVRGDVSTDALIVAALHDVVEDSDVTLDEIEEKFGRYIRNCVNVLTREKEFESYPQYIDRVMDSNLPEAKLVKHADMRDHLRQKETLTPKLKEKYFEVIDRFI